MATGIFLSICICVRYAVLTIGGPDIISLSAGEIRNPRKTIPKVARLIVGRILFFYVVRILAVGIICNSRDPRLLGAIENGEAGAAASPWVLGLLRLDIRGFLPGLINFLILLSGWSCGNAYLYSPSRTLCSLANDGQAPKIFLRCTKSGVPWVCVTAVTAISLLSFLVASNSASEVFSWFLDLTTVALVVNFTAMTWVFIGWRRALKAQGITRQGETTFKKSLFKKTSGRQPVPGIVSPFIAPCASWTPYLCLVIGGSTSIFIGFDIFQPWSLKGFITSYFGLAWFFFMFIFWKVVKRAKMPVDSVLVLTIEGGHLKPDSYNAISGYASDYGIEAAAEFASFEAANVKAVTGYIQQNKVDCDFVLTRAVDVQLSTGHQRRIKEGYDMLIAAGLETTKDTFSVDGENAEMMSGVKGAKGCFTYTTGHLWPYKLIHHMFAEAISQGINLQTNTPVTSVSETQDATGPWILSTSRGKVKARRVVFATNAYTGSLLPEYKSKIIPYRAICCRIKTPGPHPLLNNTYALRFSD
ncbi:general amino acid permease [Fusarium coicis]|nr:general amino acid permease [Fusarium coicis]